MEKKNSRSQRSTAPAASPQDNSPPPDAEPALDETEMTVNDTQDIERDAPDTASTIEPTAAASAETNMNIDNANAGDTIDEIEQAVPANAHDMFLDERNDVMEVINELEEQLDRHQEVREKLEQELKESNTHLQAASQRTQELEWQVVTLQTRVEALEQVRQDVAILEEELAGANAQIQRLNEDRNRVEQERARLRNELKTANKQLEELWAVRKERDGLRGDLKTLSARTEELERGQRDLIDERGTLTARLQETSVALDEARGERHQYQALLRVAEDRARELTQTNEELTDKIETGRTERKKLHTHITQLERENARLVEQRRVYETEISSMRNANRSAEVALSSVKKAFAEVRVALTETKTRARRRMIETWPRIGIPLRDVEGLDGELPMDDTIETPTDAAETANIATDGET